MANYIHNSLTIHAEPDIWNKIIDYACDANGFLCFDKIIPVPDNMPDGINVCDWMYENWGCRGMLDRTIPQLKRDQPERIRFTTLNGHCIPIVEKLASLFDGVRILYWSGGMESFHTIEMVLCGNNTLYQHIEETDFQEDEQYLETEFGKLKQMKEEKETDLTSEDKDDEANGLDFMLNDVTPGDAVVCMINPSRGVGHKSNILCLGIVYSFCGEKTAIVEITKANPPHDYVEGEKRKVPLSKLVSLNAFYNAVSNNGEDK